jgi:threonine/homoserine/homoserine lactone efflux protein
MIFKGLRFGMLLQLAVGPVCFLTFRASAGYGVWAGLQVALAATLVDAAFVALSGAGVAAFMDRTKVKAAVRWIGCLVLALFGVNIILGALDIPFLPEVALFAASGGSFFAQGFVLTAANPLTIIFWSGMFTAQTMKYQWNRRQLFFFAAGCVLSTILSLTAVAALGGVLGGFLPQIVIRIMNAAVGLVLIGYGIKLLLQRDSRKARPVNADMNENA